MVDVNDGIVATAGIVEGFVGAGSTDSTVLVGAVAALVGGSVAIIVLIGAASMLLTFLGGSLLGG